MSYRPSRAQVALVSLAALALGGLATFSCSLDSRGLLGEQEGNIGSVGLELSIGDVTINSLSYSITGNGFTRAGTLDVSKSKTISAQIGGIPAGTGYTLTLSGVAANNPGISCGASATFNITAGATTTAVVKLLCVLPAGNGALKVSGSANVCPRIDALSVEPSEVIVGASVALSATVTDSDALPQPASLAWSASGGALTGVASPNATFTCESPGAFTVELAVTDGDCGDTASATVTCSTDDSAPPVPPRIRVNEVESNGGVPGDWTELLNLEAFAVDISGWVFKDNDDTHAYVIPGGTVLAPGAYYVIEEAAQNFGLGSGDSARLFDATGALIDSYAWTAHAATTYGRCPDGTGAFRTTTSVTKGAPNDCSLAVKINEVESSGGVPGDWTELFNAGPVPADISGWVFKDNDDTHAYVIPGGTVLAPGAYYVIEEAAQGFGLGAADSARLFDAQGALVDSYAWTAHAATTYGRCPNGTGPFVTSTAVTKGAVNACAPIGPLTFAWPGGQSVETVDAVAQFTSNLSGLTYEPAANGSPAVLWASLNGPGTLLRMLWNGSIFTPDTNNDWGAGKALRYPNGTGNPDAEGITFAASVADGMYVATERNNDASTISKQAILRFDVSAPGAVLTATHEWDVTSNLPVVGANLGLEAITWIPDSYLVSQGFYDEAQARLYNPADYPGHGTGLFFVGVEASGQIYVFALDHLGGGFTRIATFASGTPGVMGIEFDREVGYLWVTCDDTCGNKAGILEIDTNASSASFGRFVLRRQFDRPTELPNSNNEGIAIAPEAECSSGLKPFFWSDDNDLGGNSLRRGSVACGRFLP